MNKLILTLATAAATLSGCTSSNLLSVSDEVRSEISWNAFCASRGYDTNDHTYLTENEYLDAWCGSAEEEQALINAGVEPY